MSFINGAIKLLAVYWGWRFFKAAVGVAFLLWLISK